MSADAFNKAMYSRGVRREGDMDRMDDNIRQSFKVRPVCCKRKVFI